MSEQSDTQQSDALMSEQHSSDSRLKDQTEYTSEQTEREQIIEKERKVREVSKTKTIRTITETIETETINTEETTEGAKSVEQSTTEGAKSVEQSTTEGAKSVEQTSKSSGSDTEEYSLDSDSDSNNDSKLQQTKERSTQEHKDEGQELFRRGLTAAQSFGYENDTSRTIRELSDGRHVLRDISDDETSLFSDVSALDRDDIVSNDDRFVDEASFIDRDVKDATKRDKSAKRRSQAGDAQAQYVAHPISDTQEDTSRVYVKDERDGQDLSEGVQAQLSASVDDVVQELTSQLRTETAEEALQISDDTSQSALSDSVTDEEQPKKRRLTEAEKEYADICSDEEIAKRITALNAIEKNMAANQSNDNPFAESIEKNAQVLLNDINKQISTNRLKLAMARSRIEDLSSRDLLYEDEIRELQDRRIEAYTLYNEIKDALDSIARTQEMTNVMLRANSGDYSTLSIEDITLGGPYMPQGGSSAPQGNEGLPQSSQDGESTLFQMSDSNAPELQQPNDSATRSLSDNKARSLPGSPKARSLSQLNDNTLMSQMRRPEAMSLPLLYDSETKLLPLQMNTSEAISFPLLHDSEARSLTDSPVARSLSSSLRRTRSLSVESLPSQTDSHETRTLQMSGNETRTRSLSVESLPSQTDSHETRTLQMSGNETRTRSLSVESLPSQTDSHETRTLQMSGNETRSLQMSGNETRSLQMSGNETRCKAEAEASQT